MKKLFSILFIFINCFFWSQQKLDVRFYNETVNREYTVYADNNELMPISAQFKFKATNLTNSLADNEIVVIPPKSKKFLIAHLKPIQIKGATKFEYTNSFNFGDVSSRKYDVDYVYDLPFENAKTQLIFQGYNGKFSHQNEFSLDFNLKIGEKVMAARDGIVVQVVDSFNQSCPTISCAKYNNKILIMHSDGTFADYAHLKYQGSAVKKGDLVKKGQHIGFSGNTGFSSGPHLHFMVFMNEIDGKRTSVKTLFKTAENAATYLEQGKKYTKK